MPRKSTVPNVNRRPPRKHQDSDKASTASSQEVETSFHSASTDDGLTNYGLDFTDRTMKAQQRTSKTRKAVETSPSKTVRSAGSSSRQEPRFRAGDGKRPLRQSTSAQRSPVRVRSPRRKRQENDDDLERKRIRRQTPERSNKDPARRRPADRSRHKSSRQSSSDDDSVLDEFVENRRITPERSDRQRMPPPRQSASRNQQLSIQLSSRRRPDRSRNSDDDSDLEPSRRRTPSPSRPSTSRSHYSSIHSSSRRRPDRSQNSDDELETSRGRAPPSTSKNQQSSIHSSSRRRPDRSQNSDDELETSRTRTRTRTPPPHRPSTSKNQQSSIHSPSQRRPDRSQIGDDHAELEPEQSNKDTRRGRGRPPGSTGAARRKLKRPVNMGEQIRRLREQTSTVIPKLPFSRLFREILIDVGRLQDMRVAVTALQALQEAAELYLTQLFEDSYRCTLHRDRVTLMVKDMELVRFLRGPTDPGNG